MDSSNWSEKVEHLLSEGKDSEAESVLQNVIKDAETKGDNRLGLAAALNDLGLLYCRQGLSLKADPLLQRALAIRHGVEERAVHRSNGEITGQMDALSLASRNGTSASTSSDLPPSPEEESADWETRDWEEENESPQINRKGQEDDSIESTTKVTPQKGRLRGRGAARFGGGSLYSDTTESKRWDVEVTHSRGCSRASEADTWRRAEDAITVTEKSDTSVSRADTSDDWTADRPPLASTSGMEHVLEVYGFAPSVKTMDLETLFWPYRGDGLAIKWVDDTHAVAVFRHPSVAKAALASTKDSKFKLRPFAEASLSTLRLPPEDLQPPAPRPKTTARAARRLIAGALNDRDVKKAVKAMSNPADERKQEADRKAKRNLTHQLKADAWGEGYT